MSERGRCHRCERWIEAESPSDSLRVTCYEHAAADVPFDGGEAVFTPEEWADITLDAEFERYLDSGRENVPGNEEAG